ncbi:MAG: hypothetical protein AB9842_03150 [Bacteroidales bacterium]
MEPGNQESKINKLIKDSLMDESRQGLSVSFTDKLMHKIEQKLAWKEILTEFFWKAALVFFLLVFAVAILFIPQFSGFLKMLTGFSSGWQPALYLVILVAFTIVIDQVVLKYLFFRKK